MSLYGGLKTTFKCYDCDNIFESERHDWNHSPIVAPAKCPKCGGWHTMPYYNDFPEEELEEIEDYQEIWKQDDEKKSPVKEI